MDETVLDGRIRRLLGRTAAETGDIETAREHWRAALETFEDVGTPYDALASLELLVESCREQGDDDRAERWCERAEDLLAGTPDPVADEHREWVRRQRSDLDGE
jgi:tetratricopeptide (TPR) repeat protein